MLQRLKNRAFYSLKRLVKPSVEVNAFLYILKEKIG